MILARVLFLIGSVLALFGVWSLVSPYIYQSVSADPIRAVLYLVIGGALAWFGRQLETRSPGDRQDHD